MSFEAGSVSIGIKFDLATLAREKALLAKELQAIPDADISLNFDKNASKVLVEQAKAAQQASKALQE